MTYVTIENNIITGLFCTDKKLPMGAIDVPETFSGRTGEDIRIFNQYTFERLTIGELITSGLYNVKDDEVYEDGILRNKTQIEKYIDGTDEIPEGYKLNSDKTDIELIITDAIKNAMVIAEISHLESKQDRAIREYTLGDGAAKARLQAIEDEIVVLRKKLL